MVEGIANVLAVFVPIVLDVIRRYPVEMFRVKFRWNVIVPAKITNVLSVSAGFSRQILKELLFTHVIRLLWLRYPPPPLPPRRNLAGWRGA